MDDKQAVTYTKGAIKMTISITTPYYSHVFTSLTLNHLFPRYLQVTGLMTQGKGDDEEWVTSFELSYSLDAYHWHYARDIYNNKKVSSCFRIVVFE